MKLSEHPEFQSAITSTAVSRGLSEEIVEKDYYVTEALRIVADSYGDKIVFKGGTSLSKGWDLIRRFSEDVDLLVDESKFDPALSKSQVPKELKRMRDLVASHPGLQHSDSNTQKGGTVRSDTFSYESALPGSLSKTVILEPGFLPGGHPTEEREIYSIVGKFLNEQGSAVTDDIQPFSVQCLHYTRTFVEKIFLVHGLVQRLQRENIPLERNARHYYDLYTLAGQAEVRQMLQTGGCDGIKADCAEISETSYPGTFDAPPDLSFRESIGLFPPDELAENLAQEYAEQCDILCYGPVPTFEVVLEKFREIRAWL